MAKLSRTQKKLRNNQRASRKRRQRIASRKAEYDRLEPRQLLAADFLEPNQTLATAADIGPGPGHHIETVNIEDASDIDFYRFETLATDDIEISIDSSNATVNLQLRVFDSAGSILGTSATSGNNETITLNGAAAGEYFVRVWAVSDGSSVFEADYQLHITPAATSSTRVFYINDADQTNDLYTTAVGNDLNDGLTAATPRSTVQSIIDDYDVGPNDLFVIDTGDYNSPTTIDASDEGATYVGTPFGSRSIYGGTTFDLKDADGNTFHNLVFESSYGTGILIGDFDSNDSINNTITNNTFIDQSTAIRIDGGDGDIITGNLIYGNGSDGIRYSQGDTNAIATTISNNTISDRTFGIYVINYGGGTAGVEIENNIVSNASTGIQTAYGAGGASASVIDNLVYNSGTGINVRASGVDVQGNTTHSNSTGISANTYGGIQIGGNDWSNPNLIYDNDTGISTSSSGSIQFNRIYDNESGIYSYNTLDINHNVLFGNTVYGINLEGSHDSFIVNNTLHSPSGVAVLIENYSQNIQLKNNIFKLDSGTGLHVTANSQVGFDSDYNNFFADPGSGSVLVNWQKSFTDIFDWQVESNFDSHSIGTTILETTLDNPQFVNEAGHDYRLTTSVSTSIDAGDPASLFNLEPANAGNTINLGAYGNTANAASSINQYIDVISPNYYVDLEGSVGQTIAWSTYDAGQGSQQLQGNVDIELYEVGVGFVTDIATAVPANQGTFGWAPSNLGINGNTNSRYYVRIVSNAVPAVSDTSRENFSIVPDSDDFYINDAVNNSEDQWATAVGNNRNTGQTAADPKANLLPILRSYDLGPDDTVHIDDGTYIHVRNVKISGSGGVDGNDEGATFEGPTQSGSEAIIDRANPFSGSTNIELDDADFVTLRNLTLTGAYLGLWVHNGSTNFNAESLIVSHNTNDGMRVESDSEMSIISSITAHDNGSAGIRISTPIGNLSNSVAYNNYTGISVSIYSPGGDTVIGSVDAMGNPDLSANAVGTANQNRGNLVYNNQNGIVATGDVTVFGNNVFNNAYTGIQTGSGSKAERNVVHGNAIGIYSTTGSGTVFANRVFNNSDYGIFRGNNSAAVESNFIYSNTVGVFNSYSNGTLFAKNNVVYGNTEAAFRLNRAAVLENNTIAASSGVAVSVETSAGVNLVNNIIGANGVAAIDVPASSQSGFQSDYNLFFAINGGSVGEWQSLPQNSLLEWQAASQQDGNSLQQDPLFVSANLAGTIGYLSATNYGQADDFHVKSSYGSYHGGTLVPEFATGLSAVVGLPIASVVSEVNDSGFPSGQDRSPAIDRAEGTYLPGNEVGPNGNFANLGAFGQTEFASKSPTQYVLVTSPVNAEVWPAEQAFDVKWRSHDANGLVDIELIQDSDPGFSLLIADDLTNPGEGSFNWLVPNSLTPATDYRIQITRDGTIVDQSLSNLEITDPVTIYYVNDSVYSPGLDQYTTAAGSPSNTGLSPSSPRDSIQSILNDYTLGANAQILVDNGIYNPTTTIEIGLGSGDDSGTSDGQLIISGPTAAGSEAVFDRNNTSQDVFEFVDAEYVTLQNLSITGGRNGIFGDSNLNSNLVISNNRIFDNNSDGIDIYGGTWQILGNVTSGHSDGIRVYLPQDTDTVLIDGNIAFDNSTGIQASTSSYNVVDQIIVSNNELSLNTTGIDASRSVTVRQNQAFNNSGSGIYVSDGANAIGNTAYRNMEGIQGYNYPGDILDNRVFRNSERGIYLNYRASTRVAGNQIYSNKIGIEDSTYSFGDSVIENNVIYANTDHGAYFRGRAIEFANNSVFQENGSAVLVENGTAPAVLKNNILWSENGHTIDVSDNSQDGFQSDYNIFQFPTLANTGLGLWQSVDFQNQADWFYELGFDRNSLVSDPQFIDRDGADNLLGFSTSPVGAADFLDDEDAGVSLNGSGWTEDLTDGNDGDFWTTSDVSDTATWNFSGLASGTYEIFTTWTYGFYSDHSHYEVTEPGNVALLLSETVNQRYRSPSDLNDNGVDWHRLGEIEISGSELQVVLSNLSTEPLYADAIRLQRIDGDHGVDDNFQLQPTSPAVDSGSLDSLYLAEPDAGGGRVNIGAYGNTADAVASPSQSVQVLSPNGLEKLLEGSTVSVDFRTWGLGNSNTIGLINTGAGESADGWLRDRFRTDLGYSTYHGAIDTSLVTNAAPGAVYSHYDYALNGVGERLSYDIPISDGAYEVRLHFADWTSSVGYRIFDIVANSNVELANYDIAANAGAAYTATTADFSVNVSGGNGLLLELINQTNVPAFLSAIEITQLTASAGTVDLAYSDNGGAAYTPIAGASGLTFDIRGRGSFDWTVPSPTTGNVGKVQASSGSIADASDAGFLIANDGNSYYVNNAFDATHDVYTTSAGLNTADGKSPNTPLASLASLLRAYDLNPGDTVFVDNGNYNLFASVVIDSNSSGALNAPVTILGPTTGNAEAVFDRGNSSQTVFELTGVQYVNLQNLAITGGSFGIQGDSAANLNIVVTNNRIFDNQNSGIDITDGTWQITNNTISGQSTGIDVYLGQSTDSAFIENNIVFDNSTGIRANTSFANLDLIQVVSNEVSLNNTGIEGGRSTVISQNLVFNNSGLGIYTYDRAKAVGNTVYRNQHGIYASSYAGEVRDNRIFNNSATGVHLVYRFNSRVAGNSIYSNSIGIDDHTYSAGDSLIENNVLYANSNYGIQLRGQHARISNNTIFQEVGDAIRVENRSASTNIENNILWALDGHAISVAADSQDNFHSDYNLFQFPTLTGTGLGLWQAVDFHTHADWFYELGFDQNSLVANPQFIDTDGPDNLLGYSYAPIGATEYLDDEDSGVTLTGTSWTENTTDGNQGDFWTTSDVTDTATWNFSGLASGTYEIYTTWTYGFYSDGSRYVVTEPGNEAALLAETVNKRYRVPNDLNDNGVDWHRLGEVEVSGSQLQILLSNLSTEPLYADAIRIQRIEGDMGSDDNFRVQSTSPGIDAGSLNSYYLAEPNGGGGRVNLGAYGNTAEANPSPSQYVQVLSPNGLEKFQEGQIASIDYRTWGLGTSNAIAAINSGSTDSVENWLIDRFRTDNGYASNLGAIDTTGVADAAPAAVYETYDYASSGIGERLSYEIPLSDGTYEATLHFADWSSTIAYRLFDIVANSIVEFADYDIAANAGASNTATTFTFSFNATGGTGLLLELINQTSNPAFLSGIEIAQLTASTGTVDLRYSDDDGSNYSLIAGATGLAFDELGRGTFNWTVPALTSGNVGRIQAASGILTDTSDRGFLIANNGNAFYVNDTFNSATDDYSTADGDNSLDGKTPSTPLASLATLFRAYDLEPGDVIYVDDGQYTVLTDLRLEASDSGNTGSPISIVGPTSSGSEALFDRDNTGQPLFDFVGGSYVTIASLSTTGAREAFHAASGSLSSFVTIANNRIFDNSRGIDAYGDHWQVTDNSVSGHSTGILLDGDAGLVDSNTVFDNSTGISLQGDPTDPTTLTASGNVAFNNSTGIMGTYATISQNTANNNTIVGIRANRDARILNNTTFDNDTGIVGYNYPSVILDNRSFNNATDGIRLEYRNNTRVAGNQVYSNDTGIRDNSYSVGNSTFENNVVYGNTNFGIFLDGRNVNINNNTVYQEVGDAIRVENGSNATELWNNILWVDSGRGIFVESSSQTNFNSQNNLFHTDADTTDAAKVGYWDGAEQDLLSDWQLATLLDGLSLDSDPLFIDPDGADNTLGYSSSGAAFNGGLDDNFELSANSPAIDRANIWNAPATDFFGRQRLDDNGTTNQGFDYEELVTGSSAFTENGTSQAWRSSGSFWNYNFQGGFTFTFYGQNYSSVYVSSEGFLQFGDTNDIYDNSNSTEEFIERRRIAPMWDDLRTDGNIDYDIYVETGLAGQVTFRWQGRAVVDSSDVNFSATLFLDGSIRFDYGDGNTNLTPTIGISAGNGQNYILATYDGQSSLTNANSIEFIISQIGFADIGAYEFSGSSLDVTPPTINNTNPSFIDSSGNGEGFDQIVIEFSEAISVIDGLASSNYILQDAGPNGILGDLDDVEYNLVPNYVIGSQFVTLNIASGDVPNGEYRLTVLGGLDAGIHDLAGLTLDGDNDGNEGGDYVRDFVVENLPVTIPPTALNVIRGIQASGDVSSLAFSDNTDLSIQRNPQFLTALTEFEVSATSHTLAPTSFSFTLEASVFSRRAITQTISLFNYQTGLFEQVDSRSARRFTDSVVTIDPTGDLSRFVDPSTGEIKAKIRHQSANRRTGFSSNIDQIIWEIAG